jgi:hypothetical protein
MKRLTLLLALTFTLAFPLAAETKLADLSWISGTWTATIDGTTMEEHWTTPAGGLLLGVHRDITPKRTSFEFLRIAETKDGIAYIAQPGGRPATTFLLAEASENRVVFANPAHDFPKRIIYWLHEGQLCARVEGDGGAGEQWCWSRQK